MYVCMHVYVPPIYRFTPLREREIERGERGRERFVVFSCRFVCGDQSINGLYWCFSHLVTLHNSCSQTTVLVR